MNTSWKDFVKSAGFISPDGGSFVLPAGKTPGHVVHEHNKEFPHFKISLKDILKANNNIDPSKFVAGKKYNMPVGAFSSGFKRLLESALRAGEMREIKSPKNSGATVVAAAPRRGR